MKKRKAVPLFVVLLLVFVFSFGQGDPLSDHKAPSFQQSQEDQAVDEVDTIVPAPADVKQATAVYVFLGWLWLSIGILLFFLRLKIKEVDRLHELGYFSEDKD